MEKNHIINTLDDGERVTSIYAENYFDDDYCDYQKPNDQPEVSTKEPKKQTDDEWISPSDLLIGKVELKPPFTSKIFRGQTHQGIIDIGNQVLEEEHAAFIKRFLLIEDNESSWQHVKEHELIAVTARVKELYAKMLLEKSNIMQAECSKYYEETLLDLEGNIKTEVEKVLLTDNAHLMDDLNKEIQVKLQKEKEILEDVLQKRYESEVEKITLYYKLLLNNEKYKKDRMIKKAICEHNDALKAFCKQVEAENVTTTMYVMCTERKKCKIRQFALESVQNKEIKEKVDKIKEKQGLIDSYREQAEQIADINRQWEEKISKVLQLFLKFISYCLKLLPEQIVFLLDLEKLVVLQLNEIMKSPVPEAAPPILIPEDDLTNAFHFVQPPPVHKVCDKDPFEIDFADNVTPPSTVYGSQEIYPPEKDLRTVRVQRKYVYAKCQKMAQVKAYLESLRCKCHDKSPTPPCEPEEESLPPLPQRAPSDSTVYSERSSKDLLLVDDIQRLQSCPYRACKDWLATSEFPDLNTYVDFSEERLTRVKGALSKLPKVGRAPDFVSAKEVAYQGLLFSETKEPTHNVETQYSSQEDLEGYIPHVECPCMTESTCRTEVTVTDKVPPTPAHSVLVNKAVAKRKQSLERLLNSNPKLVELFLHEFEDNQ